MAEAHQAVAFQFAVTDEGISVHFDKQAVRAAVTSLASSSKRRYAKTRAAFLRGIYPASPLSLLGVVAIIGGLSWFGFDPTLGLVYFPTLLLNWVGFGPVLAGWLTIAMFSLCVWVLLSYGQRYTLKALLVYKGWMFDPRGKQSMTTKVWAILVRLVSGPFTPQLLSYQKSLPRLPVPSLEGTCSRYLESARPLLDDEEFEKMKELVHEFKTGPGKTMQRYLVLKSWWASNYVTDWWEEYVYLHGRSSIMINSNYYGCGYMNNPYDPSKRNVSRAAIVSYALMHLKKAIENEKLKPLILMGLIPLCSAQYERLFNTTRIPGVEADKLLHLKGEQYRYCVVLHRGRYFKLQLYHKKRMLTPAELERLYQAIVDDSSEPEEGEQHLAALTAQERTSWAKTREQFFCGTDDNGRSMAIIEKAAFVLVLDDAKPTSLCEGSSEDLSDYCSRLFHGNGCNRWFDKSLTAVIFANGKLGLNAEHSWADAPIMGYLLEFSCNLEAQIGYTADGTCKPDAELRPPPISPQRLKWNMPPAAVSQIEEALHSAQEQIADLDLYVAQHDAFGKGDIKKCKQSPDAFIQMALQLAYYKDSGGKFCLTYEASMTRLYLEGRTETVRPVTMESIVFVRAMCDPNSSKEERKRLLQKATDKHTLAYKLAMTGKGIDRHLFCLYVMSKYLKMESPFLAKVLSEPWRLSTSQTPTQQRGIMDYNNKPHNITSGGGFGPVAKDGYGVSYIIPGDYVLYFHVSSFKSSPDTDSRRFAGHIADSMRELRALYFD